MWLSFSGVVSTSSRLINPHLRKTKPQLPKWIQKVGPLREHMLHGTTKLLQNLRSTKTNCLIISWELYPTLWMQWSGVFNTLLPVAPIGSRAGFALGTWNARSFFCREPSVFNRKLQLLEKQIKIHNIFCLQEVRGSDALVKKHLRLIARTHWIFCNFSSGRKNAGGVITFVSKSSVPDEACVHHTPLVAGRVSRLLIRPVTNFENTWCAA